MYQRERIVAARQLRGHPWPYPRRSPVGCHQRAPQWYPGIQWQHQCAILERAVSDMPEITVMTYFKWNGGAANQAIWYFGASPAVGAWLTPDDGTGTLRFTIRSNAVQQTLATPSCRPVPGRTSQSPSPIKSDACTSTERRWRKPGLDWRWTI